MLVALLGVLISACNRPKEIDAAGFVRVMESHPQDLDQLRGLLDTRSSVYKLSTESRQNVIDGIKKDSDSYLKELKDSDYEGSHFYHNMSRDNVEYTWRITTVSSDIGRAMTATSHDSFLVFFDRDFRIVGWKPY